MGVGARGGGQEVDRPVVRVVQRSSGVVAVRKWCGGDAGLRVLRTADVRHATLRRCFDPEIHASGSLMMVNQTQARPRRASGK